jgi:phosphate transport system permease protein
MTRISEANLPGSLGDMTRAVLSPRPGGDILAQSGGSGRSDLILGVLVRGAALTVLLMLASLVVVLFYSAMPSIKTFGVKFLVTSVWRPNEREVQRRDVSGNIMRDADGEPIIDTIPAAFGAKAVIYGTVVSSIIALVVAVPLSFGASLFLVRIASRWHLGGFLHVISFMIEFLAAIPSIAYGIWGLFVLAPFLQDHLEPMLNNFFGHVFFLRWMHTEEGLTGRDMLSAGLILGIMILPIITALSRDVLRAVPRTQIEGTLALGATWWQSCWGMLRYGRSGLFGGVMLGLARAAGETMAVAMVIGNANRISSSLFASAQTMSSLLANEFAEANSDVQRSALVEVALILLLMSLLFNVVARYLIVGKQVRMA